MTASDIKEKGQMEVKRFWIDGDLHEITSADKQPHDVVLASDFDRLTAELAALQSRLNETDAENDRLRGVASEARAELLTMKAEIGFRGETLRVIGALDMALENKHEQQ